MATSTDTYRLNADQAERAAKGLDAAFERIGQTAEKTGKRLTKAEKDARRFAQQADPTKKYAAQMDRVALAVEKGGLKIADAQVVAQKYTGQLDRNAAAGKRAFGSTAVAQLATYASGVVSVTGVLAGVRSIYAGIQQEADAAVQRVRESIDAIGELQQLADFEGNKKAAKDLVRRGIADNTSQAAGIIFQLGSSGIRGADREFLLNEVAANKLVSPSNLATFAAKATKARGALGLGDTLEVAVQKILQASEATDTDATSIAEASTLFGSQIEALRFSGDAGLGALATIIQKAPNQKVAANQLAALLTAIDKGGLSTGTLAGSVESIATQVAGGADVNKLLGNVRAVRGFRNLASQLPFLQQQTQLIASAPDRDIVGERAGLILQDPTLRATIIGDEARGAAQIAKSDLLARSQALIEAAFDFRDAASARQGGIAGRLGVGLRAAGITGGTASVARFFGGDRQFIAGLLGGEAELGNLGDGGAFSAEFEEELRQYLRDTADASQRTARNTERPADPSGGE